MQISKIKYEHILYTTEFAQNWKEVFIHAVSIANQYNAQLTLLHVLNTELIDLLTFDVGLERSSSIDKKFTMAKDFTSNVRKEILKKIADAFGESILDDKDIMVERGNPVKTILNVAEEKKCDLIVMGFKGRSIFDDSTIGDTVNRVLHRTKLPILVIHNFEN